MAQQRQVVILYGPSAILRARLAELVQGTRGKPRGAMADVVAATARRSLYWHTGGVSLLIEHPCATQMATGLQAWARRNKLRAERRDAAQDVWGARTLRLYHGTARHFAAFMPSSAGVHLGSFEQAGHVATQQLARLSAPEFAALEEDAQGFRGIVLECGVELSRTRRVSDARNNGGWAQAVAAAKRQGYDSLVYTNQWEGRIPEDSFVVFEPRQIQILGIVAGVASAERPIRHNDNNCANIPRP